MDTREARPPTRLGDRDAADQRRLVPRRLGALREGVAHVRDHDALARATCVSAANGIAFDFRGKHRTVVRTTLVDDELADASRSCSRFRAARRLFRYEWEGGRLQPHRRAPERLRARLPRRRVHGEGLPHLGRHADRRHRTRRAGPAGDRQPKPSAHSRRDAPRRQGARQYARGCAQLVRQSGGDRPVSRRQNDRGFPTATFTQLCAPATAA